MDETATYQFAQYNVKRLMEEGRRQLDMGYYVVAMQVFERIAAMKPHQYEAWYLSALCKYWLEDFKGTFPAASAAVYPAGPPPIMATWYFMELMVSG